MGALSDKPKQKRLQICNFVSKNGIDQGVPTLRDKFDAFASLTDLSNVVSEWHSVNPFG